MAVQNSAGSSAGKEKEVGKVQGWQEKAEEGEGGEGRRDLRKGAQDFASMGRRRDKLPHIPHTSLGL